jgi:RNA polymerase sigma factor (sigma-70 family)
MPDANDMELMQEYAGRNSEPAFAELVHRHINLVYSVALRFTGDSGDAQDVTQAVFIILAQKAAGLRHRTSLTGWLYETTRLTARQSLRTRIRRQAREQEAYMQSTLNDSNPDGAWQQLAPLLEEAMARLNEKERTLLALRFFENKTGAETAALLGIQEWAAHKRAERAMEKLRAFFTQRGIVLPAAVMTAAISANSVQAAPVALAKTVTAVAIAKGAAASGSITALVKGALDAMTWAKAKMGIIIGLSVILAAVTTAIAFKQSKKPSHDAYEYEADGTFEGETHLRLGDVTKWDPVSFKIYVRDGQRLIHATQPNQTVKYWEVGFDGKTMYNSGISEKKAVANVNSKADLWGGAISFDSVPFFGPEPHIPVIWLALASSSYLNDAEDRLLPPYSTEAVRVKLPATVVRMNVLPRLPETVIYFDDGFDRSEGVPKQRRPPYDKGFTNAIYTINTFTNIGGYSLPLTFNLKVFVPAYLGSGTTLYEEFNGTINHVSAGCLRTNFIPDVVSEGFIFDTRFVSADAVRKSQFPYKTNRWLSTKEVKELPGFSNYVAWERHTKNQSPVYVIHGKRPPEISLTTVQKQNLDELQNLASQERQKQIVAADAVERHRNFGIYALIVGFGLASVFAFMWRRTK